MLFTPTLDRKSPYRKDKSGLYDSITSLPQQIQATYEEIKQLKLPKSYRQVNKVVLVGMGGSALGGRVVATLLEDCLQVPLIVHNDYHLPSYVNQETLVILASYSGNTEEVLSAASEIEASKAKTVVIASGGKLKNWVTENKLPSYSMQNLVNPGNQPRMAVGHSVMGVMSILNKLGLAKINQADINATIKKLNTQIDKWKKESKTKNNQAKIIAQKIQGLGVILIAARHLRGATHVFKNQLNENAKTFAARFELPELNHHLIEGLAKPEELKGSLLFLLLDSQIYDEPIRKRLAISEDMIMQQGHETVHVLVDGESKFIQVWEVILFGEFVSYYLAILNGLDPTPIPWVDYLKAKLQG